MNNLYAHTALNLLAVLILMLIMVYLLKRFKLTKYAQNNPIRIRNSVSLGSKERIVLVEVNNTTLLLGATPSHIETLYVFNDAPAVQSENSYEQIAALTVKDG